MMTGSERIQAEGLSYVQESTAIDAPFVAKFAPLPYIGGFRRDGNAPPANPITANTVPNAVDAAPDANTETAREPGAAPADDAPPVPGDTTDPLGPPERVRPEDE